MENGVDVRLIEGAKQLTRLGSGEGDQPHAPGLGGFPHFGHDWEPPTCPGPNHQSRRRPGDLLVEREGRVAIPVTVGLGRPLLSASYPLCLHHDVVVEALAANQDGPKAGM